MRLLLIEDARRLSKTLVQALGRLGHAVDAVETGEDGELMARHHRYDAIILDRMLPGKDGLAVLRSLRGLGITTPVLLLTALDAVEERVRGLDHGADDYLTKPFAVAELAARLEALARRHHGNADPVIRAGPLEIDLARKTVMNDGSGITLTAREFSLLETLARHPGRVFSRKAIEERLYSESDAPLSNAVDAAIYSLRRKLSPSGKPRFIHTRRGLGYTFEPP